MPKYGSPGEQPPKQPHYIEQQYNQQYQIGTYLYRYRKSRPWHSTNLSQKCDRILLHRHQPIYIQCMQCRYLHILAKLAPLLLGGMTGLQEKIETYTFIPYSINFIILSISRSVRVLNLKGRLNSIFPLRNAKKILNSE